MRLAAFVVLAMTFEAAASHLPRLNEGAPPALSPRQHGQCHAAFDVHIDSQGSVIGVRLLYGTGALRRDLEGAVAHWRFDPAAEDGEPREAHVLVVALFRAAALYALGPCSPPDIALLTPSALPIPLAMSPPAYPARSSGAGVVIVEVTVGPSGQVRSTRTVGARTGFDGVAEQAARAWRFVPGHQKGRPIPTRAYLVFGFPEPVLAPEGDPR
jgi:TonB family protein